MRVDFYHLISGGVDRALPPICERIAAVGGRLLVVGDDAATMGALDQYLWRYRADSFLPHARAGDPVADDAAIVLAPGDALASLGARPGAGMDGSGADRQPVPADATDPTVPAGGGNRDVPDMADAARPGNIALIDGIWRDAALCFERCFYFFADDRIDGARAAWRSLGDRTDTERHFWKQDQDGKWREGP